MIKYLEKNDNFENLTKELCLVDFYADWCGPCKMMGKVLEDNENELNISIVKVNTDEFPSLANQFGVMSIPTLVLVKNGEVIKKHIGFMGFDELKEFIKVK